MQTFKMFHKINKTLIVILIQSYEYVSLIFCCGRNYLEKNVTSTFVPSCFFIQKNNVYKSLIRLIWAYDFQIWSYIKPTPYRFSS